MHRLRYLIGTLTLLAAIAGAWWIVKLLRNFDDRPGLALQIEFREARGLRGGADVRYRGVTVGTVRAVSIATDGSKAVAHVVLQPGGALHACVNSSFWIVTPRFSGLTDGATGLDTLVRDSYVAFQTPSERGSPLTAGSLLAGRERPPSASETEPLEDIGHGDLLMTLLVPENHGLRPGSAVVFRGMQTGDVRQVELAPSGTHVEVTLRIARKHRQSVTDKAMFWVARPYVSGALFSGFTVTDVSALLTPYVSYYGDPGKGVLVQDGYRVAAKAARPEFETSGVPSEALKQAQRASQPASDALVLVRITYAAIERDTWSADDPVQKQGSGLLFLDRSGRAIVVTARSLVDGSYTERDAFDGLPDIADEQLKVLLPNGKVLRAGRVWVHPDGIDLAALVLEDVPPDLVGTRADRLAFQGAAVGELVVHATGPDGTSLQPLRLDGTPPTDPQWIGGAVGDSEHVFGIWGFAPNAPSPQVVSLEQLPADLRPQ